MAGVYEGWLKFWNRNFERWLYLFHRVTGVAVGIYFVAHIWETGFAATAYLDVKAGGTATVWTNLMASLTGEFFHTGLLLVVLAAVFHSLNGVRLFLVEQGWLMKKGEARESAKPVSLVSAQRYLGVALVAASFLLTAYAFYQLFIVALGW